MTPEHLAEIRSRIDALAAARAKMPDRPWTALRVELDGWLTHVVTAFPEDAAGDDPDYDRAEIQYVCGDTAEFLAAANNLHVEKDAKELLNALEYSRREHANFLNELIAACNFDPAIVVSSPEATIRAVVRRKVAEFDQRIETAQRAVDHWRETAEAENTARGTAESERDRLIEACVQETWRRPVRTMSNAWDDTPDDEHGFEWRFGPMGGFFYAKADAIKAVRKAAGLEN